ncbi:Ni/Fe hydrogenase subunit alpha [Nocardia miyunensis]|uniref:Ni/Fe hydrogenase subunit alpha n=1 Tax=Nocardia miyunensis TaxID=282684 RepID=UPI00082C3AC8|nr:Ni/Fe hydrogenase subunit alpha [Nocardia miyunensis]
MTQHSRHIHVGSLTRVEGEGALRIVVSDGTVERAELNIYEPPRFFEALLRGRAYTEPPDITARICGICPVAYQTSACNALEQLCGIELDPPLERLRRLLYCGEWISSHSLHIFLLHLPDFLGYPDAITMAADHRDLVEQGLMIKKTGNALLELIGGRPIHPINVRVGGFYSVPTPADVQPITEQLRRALHAAIATARRTAHLDFPDLELPHDLLAATHPNHYAIESGDLHTSTGTTFTAQQFPDHITEHQAPHSTALHAALDGRRYLTGPLARYTLNSTQLSLLTRHVAAEIGLGPDCRNPFRSILVRTVELAYALEEALRLIEDYETPYRAAVPVEPRAGTGHGVSEAPRGLLYHRYQTDTHGVIRAASIVPPTSQNQAAIEDDLRRAVDAHLELDDAPLTALCERTIRNYDPCISCAAHFLRLELERR